MLLGDRALDGKHGAKRWGAEPAGRGGVGACVGRRPHTTQPRRADFSELLLPYAVDPQQQQPRTPSLELAWHSQRRDLMEAMEAACSRSGRLRTKIKRINDDTAQVLGRHMAKVQISSNSVAAMEAQTRSHFRSIEALKAQTVSRVQTMHQKRALLLSEVSSSLLSGEFQNRDKLAIITKHEKLEAELMVLRKRLKAARAKIKTQSVAAGTRLNSQIRAYRIDKYREAWWEACAGP